ncbi:MULTISPECIES: hypothetical protein [Hyphobacterium]|uniref:Uncharacterized protein n=1 Tax=Hyphobacterium vulgare TaxID=1736751 RepID=A0ABV6ZWX0_9PROT
MTFQSAVAVIAAGALTTACATTGYTLRPVEAENTEIRYERGFATVTSYGEQGSVMVYPAGANSNRRLLFDVAVINHSETSVNFGLESLELIVNGQTVGFFTRDELAEEARRQRNAQIAAAILIGAAAAYAAADMASSSGHGYISGPYGTTTYAYSHYNATAAVLGSALAAGVTAEAISEINGSMERTLGELGGAALETTTVDSGYSFGGRATARPFEAEALPEISRVTLIANLGGEEHRFEFDMSVGAPNLYPYQSGLVGDSAPAGK